MLDSKDSRCLESSGQWFATTHWSVVLAAGQGHGAGAEAALDTLCRTYWYPLYAYARQRGRSSPDAQDSTQGFFAHFLYKEYFRFADQAKGKFRSFLLIAFKRFLVNEYEHSNTIKRGGGQVHIELDNVTAEELYRFEPGDRS